MQITPTTKWFMSSKQHSLNPSLTVEDIASKLPGIQDQGRSGDGKCTHTWEFFADGKECSIWDYKGARWSAWGPREVFEELGFF